MQRIVWRASVALLATVCILGFSGCAKKGVVVKGKVNFPKNVKVTADQFVTIGFNPQDKDVLASTAVYNADDQTFEAKGIGGKGLIPGKYTITVSVMEAPKPSGSPSKEQMLKELDFKKLSARFDPSSSPLSVEITPTTQNITIDLETGTATAN